MPDKTLTLTVAYFGAADNGISLTQIQVTNGYLYTMTGYGTISGGGSTIFAIQPYEVEKAVDLVGTLSFLLGETEAETMTVNFQWPDTSKPGVKVTTNQIPGFSVSIEDDNLNDPNNPSCWVMTRDK